MDLSGVKWRKSSYSTSSSNCVEVGVGWRKSSYSTSNGACVEVGVGWQKSSHSGSNGGACVEIASDPSVMVAVRDSKDPGGPVLAFSPDAWKEFAAAVKAGEFHGPG